MAKSNEISRELPKSFFSQLGVPERKKEAISIYSFTEIEYRILKVLFAANNALNVQKIHTGVVLGCLKDIARELEELEKTLFTEREKTYLQDRENLLNRKLPKKYAANKKFIDYVFSLNEFSNRKELEKKAKEGREYEIIEIPTYPRIERTLKELNKNGVVSIRVLKKIGEKKRSVLYYLDEQVRDRITKKGAWGLT